VGESGSIETAAEKITSMSYFDLSELIAFIEQYAITEKETLYAAFNRIVEFNSYTARQCTPESTISVNKLPQLMRELQLVVLQKPMQEILQRAGLAEKETLDINDVVRVVAAYPVCQGFTSAELEKAQESFEEAAQNECLSIADLPNALLDFFGVHCITNLRKLVSDAGTALQEQGLRESPVSFAEFLSWAQQLQNSELLELHESFQAVTMHGDIHITAEALFNLMSMGGFTLSTSEASEIFEASGLQEKTGAYLTFEDAVAFLKSCRDCEGFALQDKEELIAAHKKFDTEGEGELSTLQVMDLLRYLGYQVSVEDVETYARKVDFNGNGTMDVNEYLRLMRLHREDDLDTVRQVFLRRRSKNGRLPLECLHEALKECKCCPSHCDVFAEIYEGASNSSLHGLSLAELQIFADKCTKAVKQVQKQRANFSDAEFALLKDTFQLHDGNNQGSLDENHLQMLLHRCGIPLHTAELRREGLAILNNARQAAIEAEISLKDVGDFNSFSATFWVMVHTWRGIARQNECKRIDRLEEARIATSFSLTEVEEFREVFASYVKRSKTSQSTAESQPVLSGRRSSLPDLRHPDPQDSDADGMWSSEADEGNLEEDQPVSLDIILGLSRIGEHMAVEDLKKLLASLHLKFSSKCMWTLEMKVESLTGSRAGGLDMANFLYVMRWMMDTNFAHVNELTAFAASRKLGQSSPQSDVATSTNNEAWQDKPCFAGSAPQPTIQRRASI
jgi:Ca2+-binding EF-hand superfamily protein